MKVKLADYNPDWVNLYYNEKDLIEKALGNIPFQIRHVGSTAVPGLGAKPVIDILIGINSYSELKNIIPLLTQIGFEYRNLEHLIPGWAYFTKPKFCHVHVVELESEFFRRQIVFRDYLRTHDNARDEYFKVKKELAQIDWKNPMDYSFAKDEFIRSTEKKAYEYITNKIEIAEALALEDVYCDSSLDEQFIASYSFKKLGPCIITNVITKHSGSSIGVLNLGVFEEADEKFIDFLIDFNKSVNGNEFRVTTRAISKPENLKEILLNKGFRPDERAVNFYRSLYSFEEPVLDLDIRELEFNRTDFFNDITSLENRNTCTLKDSKQNWHTYAVFENDKPIASASMYFYKDTAWLGFASTLPEHRNKGAQRALIIKRLSDAKKTGCKWATAGTHGNNSNPSYRNLIKMGFSVLYSSPFYSFKPGK